MKPGTLPTERAFEPNERAHQPMEDAMTPHLERQPSRRQISFADDTDPGDNESSQKSRDALSQPPHGLSQRQKLLWLQKRRTEGLWAQCDDCNQWRYLPNVLDRYELPARWHCKLNPDASKAHCSIPEAPISLRDEEDLIHSEYSAGSVVWAHMTGFPWWPAMVDDCPDIEQFYWLDGFSDIPTHYNVVFFDSKDVKRSWIPTKKLKPYAPNRKSLMPVMKDNKYKHRIQLAMNQADDASSLSLADRLQKYSFLARYKGSINTPKKLAKNDVVKHKKVLKRKFNIEFESDSEDEWQPKNRKNVIMLGTPKTSKAGQKDDKKVVAPNNKNTVEKPELANQEKNTEISDQTDGVFKEPSSLAVQKGSLVDSLATGSFDDDSSKTFVPEKNTEQSTESVMSNTASAVTEFQVRFATPSSDDFDF